MPLVFPDPTPIFPTLRPTFPVSWMPNFFTPVLTSVSGFEWRASKQAFPLWEFSVKYDLLADETQNQIPDPTYLIANMTELQQLMGLYLVCQGQRGRFFYSHEADNSRTGQVIGTGNAGSTLFRVVRTIGFGSLAFPEPVGGVNVATKLYADDVEVPGTDWQITPDKLYVNTINGFVPGEGVILTLDFSFYYFCRWLEDVVDFEQFARRMWTTGVKFRSVKR